MIWWVILLFIGGVILILAEFLLPGGICGSVGLIMVVLSCVIGWTYYPDYFIWIFLVELFGVIATIAGGFYLLTRVNATKKLVVEETQAVEKGYVSVKHDPSLLGKVGKVIAPLRPAGIIELDGKRIDAVSSGKFVEVGSLVKVVEISGPSILVEELIESENKQ
ncbi:MAG: hypothetical protein N3G21_05180 [Candidatus Hydrogenedentes bacterium]|nr:hypothetical protein [Candidatus Hydrogenedentota bacterium]